MMNKKYIKRSNLITTPINYPLFFLLAILLTICTIQPLEAQNEPQWVNMSPFTEDNNGTVGGFFLNANKGWIWETQKYKKNVLYYTDDGAETFVPTSHIMDSLAFFYSLQMLNENIGYAKVGWQNNQYPYNDTTYISKTTDGGHTWNDIQIDTSFLNQSPFPLDGKFYFIDTLTGFTSRGEIVEEGYNMVISKTTDGAITWEKTEILGLEEVGLSIDNLEYVDKFFFYDSLHGWAACGYGSDGGFCLSTSDGGKKWYPSLPYGGPFFDIHFISPQKGGCVGHSFFSQVYLTEDNFLSLSYENQSWPQYAKTICYQNDTIIWISGDPGIFYRSMDNGNSFQVFENVPNDINFIYNIKFFGNTGYAFGKYNLLLKFQDTLDVGMKNKTMGLTKELRISPNPASEKIEIIFPQNSSGCLQLFNSEGKKVFTKKIINSNQISLCITNVKEGLLYVKFISENGKIYNQKLVKYH